jgi:hypothetical protein
LITGSAFATPSSHDFQGLLKFLDRPEWSAYYRGVLDHHSGRALGPAGMDFGDLMVALGEAMAVTLWGAPLLGYIYLSSAARHGAAQWKDER